MKKTVDALPVTNQTEYPALPELPEGRLLKVFDSPMQNSEKEDVLAILATAAIREGKWHAVPEEVFGDILAKIVMFWHQNVVSATWALAEEGLVEVLELEEKLYVLPTPNLAKMLEVSKLRYM